MSRLLLIIALCLFSLQALAWREGNGGDGVRMNDKVFLLDLVEGGTENLNETNVSCQSEFLVREMGRWGKSLPVPVPTDIVLSKICQVYTQNPVLGLTLMSGFEKLQWKWISLPLRELDDEGRIVRVSKGQLIQLALRINQTVQIQNVLWSKMNARNQAALLFHEVLYALMKPLRNAQNIDMNSPKVRRLVGFLFSSELQNSSLESILRTEAPHLIFPVDLQADPNPLWDDHREKIFIYPNWYASFQFSQGERWRSENRTLIPPQEWTWLVCGLALKTKGDLTLGLEVDELQVLLTQKGVDGKEEFYLSPQIKSRVGPEAVDYSPGNDLPFCIQQTQQTIQRIQTQLRTNFVRSN